MNNRHLYRIWAPPSGLWSRWAKPVLFAHIDATTLMRITPIPGTAPVRDIVSAPPMLDPGGPPVLPPVLGAPPAPQPIEAPPSLPPILTDSETVRRLVPPLLNETVIVVDLPGETSVKFGVALASQGYQPVPLFNACPGPNPLVPLDGMMLALMQGATVLATLPLASDAPPAFLLDSERQGGAALASPGRFDNRSVVFPQDFPSANFLRARGFREVVVFRAQARAPREDLAHVLLRWQEAGLSIVVRDPTSDAPGTPITITRPWRFREMWYRVLTLAGLRRNSTGGFGAVVPMPSSSSGFG